MWATEQPEILFMAGENKRFQQYTKYSITNIALYGLYADQMKKHRPLNKYYIHHIWFGYPARKTYLCNMSRKIKTSLFNAIIQCDTAKEKRKKWNGKF